MRVPQKLSDLMDSGNAAAAVRAAPALEQLSKSSRAEPTRRINTGGIVIMLGTNTQRVLPNMAEPALELEPTENSAGS
jgi:hypothetical protein